MFYPTLLVFLFDNEFIQILEILASRYNVIVVFGVLRRFDKIYCPLRFGTTIFRIGHFDLRPKTVTNDILYTKKRFMHVYRQRNINPVSPIYNNGICTYFIYNNCYGVGVKDKSWHSVDAFCKRVLLWGVPC